MDQLRADLVLGSPLGRQFLAGRLGFSFGEILSEQLGPGQLPGRQGWLGQQMTR